MELWVADLVCPVDGPPIRRGAVLTSSGRVLAVGEEAFVRPAEPVAEERDFGRAILIPGLVNAHTHLELSGLKRKPGPMEDWIVSLVREMRGWPAHLFLASAQIGAVGDVSTSGESATAISGAGMRGVVFHEVLGLDPARADEVLAEKMKACDLFPEYKGLIPNAVRHGLSPHAPYSASLALYRAVLKEARARGWPVATHLGESMHEVEFLQDGGGALARVHHELNGQLHGFKPSGLRPAAHL
ncbi:MAG: amidohydrolase family protein, partial [Nitrospinae bacterium]|nr:amidohydrolase family protein [Nitrospinota bacterium]